MQLRRAMVLLAFLAAGAGASISTVYGHGDAAPQPVDTTGLDAVGSGWLEVNPYREKGGKQYELAQQIGASGYTQNCARCHGLEVVSGGIAPDLRYLDAGADGDQWFIQRIRHGYSQDGSVKMPPFENILSQEAMWAIRSYIETRPN